MTSKTPTWLRSVPIGFAIVTFAITAIVYYWLLELRGREVDFEQLPIFLNLFVSQDYWASLAALAVLLLAAAAPLQRLALDLERKMGEHRRTSAAMAFGLLVLGALFVYRAHPLSMDEYSPFFQSEIFAAGRLTTTLPAPLLNWLIPDGFQSTFFRASQVTGEVISGYWPGYAMLLTPFTLVNVPWLANPLLAALSLLVMCRLATDVFGSSRAVGWVLLFTLAAPAFTVNAISYYSMTSHLLFNATFALCLIRPTVLRAFLAGLVGSYALILHNPFPHALFAAPWIVWLALQRDRMRLLGSLAAGYLPVAVVLGIGWALLTGQVLGTHAFNLVGGDGTFIASWTARVERIFQLPGLALLNARAIGLAKLWLWTGPAVLAIALIGAYRQRSNVYVRLLTLSAVTTFAGFLFVPFDQGHGWGFRYFHSAWFVLPILSAGAFAANAQEDASAQRLRGYVAACAVLSLCAMTTLRAVQVRAFMDHHLAQLPTVDGGRPRIVIVNPSLGYYAWDLVQNDPFLRTPAIRMITHGRKVDEAMMAERFPDMKLLDRSYKGTVWGPSRGSSGAPAGPEPASP